MAVKQNNDANDTPKTAIVGNNVTPTGTGGTGKIVLNGGTNCSAKINEDDGGGDIDSIGDTEGVGVDANIVSASDMQKQSSNNVDENISNKKKKNATISNTNNVNLHGSNGATLAGTREISLILHLINKVETKQMQTKISSQEMLKIYNHLILQLSLLVVPINDMTRFKEDIAKVGNFFGKTNDRRLYLIYLRLVCQLITQPDIIPSPAIAIIFQLFDSEMVLEAIQSLLEHNLPDQDIRKTALLLCEWLRTTNFCQNLNLWVMALLAGLLEQQKFELYNVICLDNVDQLFASLVLPILRPKVAPIVFHMLSSVQHTPQVFHKVIRKFPKVLQFIKQQSKNMDSNGEDIKIIQQLVDLTSALMVRFYDYDGLYAPVEEALKDFRPSYNYLNYAKMQNNNDISAGGDDMLNSNNAKVGLVNLGNTCYMNSVLQALAMTKEFCREILLTRTTSPLLIKMQQQIALMLYSLRYELIPTSVLNATRPPGFSPGLQQDSSEFLGYLLETLHEQEVAYSKKLTINAQLTQDNECILEQGAAALHQASSMTTTTYNTKNSFPNVYNTVNTSTSPSNSSLPTTIDKTFTGKLATTYKCLTCGWKSRNIDCFRDLQLSFPEIRSDCSASNYSVQDLIDYYCSPEKLYGENQYFCERCKKLSDAERYINVINAPKNLILTLKHFKYDQKYHTRAKLMHKVFHDEKVSVKVCAAESLDEIASVHYDLYAGVVHSGFSMDSGHYYTYAADATNNWYKFNDSIVTPSNSEELHNLSPPNTPYILFYQMSARSNEIIEATSSSTTIPTTTNNKLINVEIPTPLNLDELPSDLRDYVVHDNRAFTEELKLRRFQMSNSKIRQAQTQNIITRRDNYDNDDDDDDDNLPPTGGCGGNSLNMNMNRFVY